MKPYVHAKNSQVKYGGYFDHHLLIHEKMDSSKSVMPDVRHRAFFHHSLGISIMKKIFKSKMLALWVQKIATQHIKEDLGFIPNIRDYLKNMKPNEKLTKQQSTDKQAANSVAKYGGQASDYFPIHDVIDNPSRLSKNRNTQVLDKSSPLPLTFLFHNAFGAYIIQDIFDYEIENSDNVDVSVRQLVEDHCMMDFDGWIPTAQEWLEHICIQDWMIRPAVRKQQVEESSEVYVQPKIIIETHVHHRDPRNIRLD